MQFSEQTPGNTMLPRSFYETDPLAAARALIGCELVWGGCRGLIVETEAYAEFGDEACHTFSRKSSREFVAINPPGTAYIYLNYGMYFLFNVLVKSAAGNGFVLVRAVQPTHGIELMCQRRGLNKLHSLCSGPGKLTIAFDILRHHHGIDLCADVTQSVYASPAVLPIETDIRVGITRSAEFPWRFLHQDSRFISARRQTKLPVL